jgi:small subunit ribosomal protein S9
LAEEQRYYGTGHRKTSIARVWLARGDGAIQINDKGVLDYLCQDALVSMVREPLVLTGLADQFSVRATAKGGGPAGQAGALRHGIAKALLAYDPELRVPLKRAGLLTRDPRVKERKKWGHKRARRGFQFSKR